jgi:hypothetical protein
MDPWTSCGWVWRDAVLARLTPMLLALLCLNNPGLRLQNKDIDMFRSTQYDHAVRFVKSIYSYNTVVYARRARSGMVTPSS